MKKLFLLVLLLSSASASLFCDDILSIEGAEIQVKLAQMQIK